MKGIHLALIPAVTLASGTIRWEKFNHCLDRDVLSDELQGEILKTILRFNLIKNNLDLLNLFIENTADTCDDSCLNGLSECITCLQVSRPCFL